MPRLSLLCTALLVALAGCTLPQDPPDVPTAPTVEEQPLPASREPTPSKAELLAQFVMLPPTLPPEAVPRTEPLWKNGEPKNLGKAGKHPALQSPSQLIEEANQKARLAPSHRGYFGGGATHRYQWSAGRVYDVYLSPSSGTRITFPPGEVLAHELILNADSFDVSQVTVGNELSRSTVLFIRPCAETENACKPATSVDVALVSESGRSYDLHLIVGKVGMVGVTWAIAPVVQIQIEEAPPTPGSTR